jgi:hypothetical protein
MQQNILSFYLLEADKDRIIYVRIALLIVLGDLISE